MSGLKMKYFVLKPEGVSLHAIACREAMRTYADIIEEEIPELADDLKEWIRFEEYQAKKRKIK